MTIQEYLCVLLPLEAVSEVIFMGLWEHVAVMDQPETLHLRFDGSLTIGRVKDVHNRLLDAIRTSPRIELDCSAVEEVDTAFVQLLVAACRCARASAKGFGIWAPTGGALWEAVERSGLDPEELGLTMAAGHTEKGVS